MDNSWFKFAKEDLITAEAILEKKVYNQVCFHSQQGTEKMLKGFLKKNNQNVPKIHSIEELIKLCGEIDKNFSKIKMDIPNIFKLDNYYIPTRYPEALPGMLADGIPNKEDAEQALQILKEVMKFVKDKIK